jgi:prepilin-type processing-associated H-X9-DG protein
VSAALFLLVKTQDITPDAFLCPSARVARGVPPEKLEAARPGPVPPNRVNFRGPEELSYSYANPYPSREAIANGYRLNNAVPGEFVVAGDLNPAAEELTKLTAASDPGELRKVNSPNHQLDGQNVLFGDGHVEIISTPFAGVQRDNIYTYGDSGEGSGGTGIVGSPVGPGDSVLLPIVEADDVGAAAPAAPAAPAPAAAPR